MIHQNSHSHFAMGFSRKIAICCSILFSFRRSAHAESKLWEHYKHKRYTAFHKERQIGEREDGVDEVLLLQMYRKLTDLLMRPDAHAVHVFVLLSGACKRFLLLLLPLFVRRVVVTFFTFYANFLFFST